MKPSVAVEVQKCLSRRMPTSFASFSSATPGNIAMKKSSNTCRNLLKSCPTTKHFLGLLQLQSTRLAEERKPCSSSSNLITKPRRTIKTTKPLSPPSPTPRLLSTNSTLQNATRKRNSTSATAKNGKLTSGWDTSVCCKVTGKARSAVTISI